MSHLREETARSAAAKIAAITPDARESRTALIGFDGFIDSILHMVDRRTDMTPTGYTRIETIAAFSARCAAAAGRSTNIEQVLVEDRFGGNGPLLAGALASLETPTTYIGAISDHQRIGIHPVFAAFAAKCRKAVAIGPPSSTLCLEFDDGKLMFNNTSLVQAVTWGAIVKRIGLEPLIAMFDEADLIGVVNWSLLGGVPGIWRGMMKDVWPRIRVKNRRLAIDLSDPAKRTDEDVRSAMGQLLELNGLPGLRVTLGLNLAESERIVSVMGGDVSPARSMATLGETVMARAAEIQRLTDLDCIAVHPREGAGAATAGGEAAWIEGPFTNEPRLSTGAGDHFNAGFVFGQLHSMTLGECLACGVAVSGAYVRDARSPDVARLHDFLIDLPMPESKPGLPHRGGSDPG